MPGSPDDDEAKPDYYSYRDTEDDDGRPPPGSLLRLHAVETLKSLCNAFPIINKRTGRPNAPTGFVTVTESGRSRIDEEEEGFPPTPVMPDDMALHAEIARRIVAAGLPKMLVILGYSENQWFLNYCMNILGGLALEPSCAPALVGAGALPGG